jgi:hypothetical protein
VGGVGRAGVFVGGRVALKASPLQVTQFPLQRLIGYGRQLVGVCRKCLVWVASSRNINT